MGKPGQSGVTCADCTRVFRYKKEMCRLSRACSEVRKVYSDFMQRNERSFDLETDIIHLRCYKKAKDHQTGDPKTGTKRSKKTRRPARIWEFPHRNDVVNLEYEAAAAIKHKKPADCRYHGVIVKCKDSNTDEKPFRYIEHYELGQPLPPDPSKITMVTRSQISGNNNRPDKWTESKVSTIQLANIENCPLTIPKPFAVRELDLRTPALCKVKSLTLALKDIIYALDADYCGVYGHFVHVAQEFYVQKFNDRLPDGRKVVVLSPDALFMTDKKVKARDFTVKKDLLPSNVSQDDVVVGSIFAARHIYFCVFDQLEKSTFVYDPKWEWYKQYPGLQKRQIKTIQRHLFPDSSHWNIKYMKKCIQQPDLLNCGYFCIHFLKLFLCGQLPENMESLDESKIMNIRSQVIADLLQTTFYGKQFLRAILV